jgi:hypothetical protein
MKNENSVPELAVAQPLTDAQKAVLGPMQEAIETMYAMGNKPFIISGTEKNAPAGLPVGHVHGGLAPGLATENGPDTHPGGFAKKLLDLFFSEHPERREEIESFEASQLAELQAIRKFKSLQGQLNDFRAVADAMKIEISNHQQVDLARTLFENRFKLAHFTAVVTSADYQTAVALKSHGKDVLKLLEGELEAMQKAYYDHVKANKELLQNRGLL